MVVLMDLERTIGSGRAFYWRSNRHGYTTDIEEAGRFSDEAAEQILADDIDGFTVAIGVDEIEKILAN